MKQLRIWSGFLVLLGSCSFAAAADHYAIIYQQRIAKTEDNPGDPNVNVDGIMAELLQKEGRVIPVVWGSGDPTFRSWTESHLLKDAPQAPEVSQLLAAARTVRADFVIVISAIKVEGRSVGSAMLYRASGGKPIWRDSRDFELQVAGINDWDNAALTLANTWVSVMGTGPFKDLRPRATLEAPKNPLPKKDPDPIPVPNPEPPPKQQPSAQILIQADALVRQGQDSEAVRLLRDGVDDQPLDGTIRKRLIEILINTGHQDLAADEASRFAKLSVRDRSLILTAAEIWIQLGRSAEAEQMLQELQAREGDQPTTQLLAAKISLIKDRMAQAQTQFEQSFRATQSYDAALGWALAAAAQGRKEDLNLALAALKPLKAVDVVGSYRWAIGVLDARQDMLAEQFRDALREATAAPKSPVAISKCAKMSAIAETLMLFVTNLQAPAAHQWSHPRRELAHKLLLQAADECAKFAQSGDEDAGADCTLSLGEALQQFNSIRERVSQELAGK